MNKGVELDYWREYFQKEILNELLEEFDETSYAYRKIKKKLEEI